MKNSIKEVGFDTFIKIKNFINEIGIPKLCIFSSIIILVVFFEIVIVVQMINLSKSTNCKENKLNLFTYYPRVIPQSYGISENKPFYIIKNRNSQTNRRQKVYSSPIGIIKYEKSDTSSQTSEQSSSSSSSDRGKGFNSDQLNALKFN